MPTRLRRWTIAVLAIIAMAATAGTSEANTITAEPAGAITMTSEGYLTFSVREEFEMEIVCRATLGGSVNRTIANEPGGLFGSITSGRTSGCLAFTAMVFLFISPNTYPMSLNESAILEGAIDRIVINLLGVQIRVEIFGLRCVFIGRVPTQLEGAGSPVVTRTLNIQSNIFIRSSGSELCGETGELFGIFHMTTQTLTL